MSKLTRRALLSRGIDSHTTDSIIKKGLYLKDLKQKSLKELLELGIRKEEANELLKESRPPIPNDTLVKLLHSSKRVCCICRDSSKPIVVHHINEWNKSRSHDEDNLVVLCLEHHDSAHTKKELSKELTKKEIKKHKKLWEKQVATQDAKAILGLVNDWSRWDYFNNNRVFEMFFDSNLAIKKNARIKELESLNILNAQTGSINSVERWELQDKPSSYLYDFYDGMMLSHYMKQIWEAILNSLEVLDLTGKLHDKTFLKSLVTPGKFISLQAGFYFKKETSKREGRKQIRTGYYKNKNIKIEFILDAFECTSTSSWAVHLAGHKLATPILLVKSVVEDDQKIKVNCSCLAIGSYLSSHPQKNSF